MPDRPNALTAACLAAALLIAGCSTTPDEPPPPDAGPMVDQGLAALTRGDLGAAGEHFEDALEVDPQNPYALTGAGFVHRRSGRPEKAREMFEAVLALDPPPAGRPWVGTNGSSRPILAVAADQVDALTDGAPLDPGAPAAPLPTTGPDANVLARFSALRRLYDRGLVAEDEYVARRRANLGALLPLTFPPPSRRLDLPLPPERQIAARLQSLARLLESGVMTAGEHTRERLAILDALMPADAGADAPRGRPIGARQLEQLHRLGFVTKDELAAEQKALDAASNS